MPLEEALNRAYARSVEMLFGEVESGRTISTHAVMRSQEDAHIVRGARLIAMVVRAGREIMPDLLVLNDFGRWKLWCWGKRLVEEVVEALRESLTGGYDMHELEQMVDRMRWDGMEFRDCLIRSGHCRGLLLRADEAAGREGRVEETPERRRLRSDEVESIDSSVPEVEHAVVGGEGTMANPLVIGEVQVYDSQLGLVLVPDSQG